MEFDVHQPPTPFARACVFFDRDGIVNRSPGADYVGKVENFEILPEFLDALRVVSKRGYPAIVVTNQKCISTGIVPEEAVQSIHANLLKEVSKAGLQILDLYYCPYGGEHPDRKPAPGMLLKAAKKHNLDLDRSWMIGDSERDVVAGSAAGCHTVLVEEENTATTAQYRIRSMADLAQFLREHL